VSAKAKPKQLRARPDDLEVLDDAKPTRGRKTVQAKAAGLESKPTDNGKSPRRRNPAKKTKRQKTADELMMEVWQYTWENRHRRLTKP